MRAPGVSAGVLTAACVQEGDRGNAGSPVGGAPAPTGNPRGPAWAGRVAERPVVARKRGNARGAKGPWFERDARRGKGRVETGKSLGAPERVRGLQTALHVKAKGDPGFRFYTLSDKVWREDVLAVAWQAVRRNGGACGVDGETFERIEERGVDGWLGGLASELQAAVLNLGVLSADSRFGGLGACGRSPERADRFESTPCQADRRPSRRSAMADLACGRASRRVPDSFYRRRPRDRRLLPQAPRPRARFPGS